MASVSVAVWDFVDDPHTTSVEQDVAVDVGNVLVKSPAPTVGPDEPDVVVVTGDVVAGRAVDDVDSDVFAESVLVRSPAPTVGSEDDGEVSVAVVVGPVLVRSPAPTVGLVVDEVEVGEGEVVLGELKGEVVVGRVGIDSEVASVVVVVSEDVVVGSMEVSDVDVGSLEPSEVKVGSLPSVVVVAESSEVLVAVSVADSAEVSLPVLVKSPAPTVGLDDEEAVVAGELDVVVGRDSLVDADSWVEVMDGVEDVEVGPASEKRVGDSEVVVGRVSSVEVEEGSSVDVEEGASPEVVDVGSVDSVDEGSFVVVSATPAVVLSEVEVGSGPVVVLSATDDEGSAVVEGSTPPVVEGNVGMLVDSSVVVAALVSAADSDVVVGEVSDVDSAVDEGADVGSEPEGSAVELVVSEGPLVDSEVVVVGRLDEVSVASLVKVDSAAVEVSVGPGSEVVDSAAVEDSVGEGSLVDSYDVVVGKLEEGSDPGVVEPVESVEVGSEVVSADEEVEEGPSEGPLFDPDDVVVGREEEVSVGPDSDDSAVVVVSTAADVVSVDEGLLVDSSDDEVEDGVGPLVDSEVVVVGRVEEVSLGPDSSAEVDSAAEVVSSAPDDDVSVDDGPLVDSGEDEVEVAVGSLVDSAEEVDGRVEDGPSVESAVEDEPSVGPAVVEASPVEVGPAVDSVVLGSEPPVVEGNDVELSETPPCVVDVSKPDVVELMTVLQASGPVVRFAETVKSTVTRLGRDPPKNAPPAPTVGARRRVGPDGCEVEVAEVEDEAGGIWSV
ncbi:hypothetical protein HDU97_004585 [Phlyctochytrium planicorne]|nr:hypothetical protein HDU97_004585 [Phlyctochytrium planicorne]